MTPRGSTVGIDDWPKRWEEKARALETVDWSTFRRNPVLMEGIETNWTKLALWVERARSLGVKPEHWGDPMVGSPRGEVVSGFFATSDSVRMACYVQAIAENWPRFGWRPFDVLDIGGGYGALLVALWIRSAPSGYYVLDSEPLIRLQHEYARRTTSLPCAERFEGMGVDLVVNTNSFGEMDLPEVTRYFEIIERWLVDGGAFYTQNRIERVTDFGRYPYGPGWRHVLVRHPFGDEAWVEALSIRDPSANDPHPLEML